MGKNKGVVYLGPGKVEIQTIPDPKFQQYASDDIKPFSAGGAYVNFIMDEGQERVRATYRDNYERLARIKARYDPKNVFHVNQNIRPA